MPVRDDRLHFELLTLEAFQAGLSWLTILAKRPAFREAFENFDPGRVARFGEDRVRALLADEGIVRHRGKIEATIGNARAFRKIQAERGSFDGHAWDFVGDEVLRSARNLGDPAPSASPESEALSRDLRARGFRFLGPTTCYAYMQAAGLVNDHAVECFRHRELGGPGR